MSLILGVEQNGKALRLDASLLQCTLPSRALPHSNFANNFFASSCDSRRPTICSGRPHVFGHIPSSLCSFEHKRLRRKAHLKSLPLRGRFCYSHLSVCLAHWRAQSWLALCVPRP